MRARSGTFPLAMSLTSALMFAAPGPASAATDLAAGLKQVEALSKERRFAAADSTARVLWREASAAEGDSSLAVAKVWHALALVLVLDGRAGDPECLKLAQGCLAIRGRQLKDDDPDLAWAHERVARVHRDRGEFALARPAAERAVEILLRAFGPDALETARGHNTLGGVLMRLGEVEAARAQFQRLLEIRRKHLLADDPEVASGLHNVAVAYLALDDQAAAEPLLREALAIRERALGPEHPLVGSTLGMLGLLVQDRGDLRQGIELETRALQIQEKISGPDHPELLTPLLNLGTAVQLSQDYSRSRALFERATRIIERSFGPDHPDLLHPLQSLAQNHYIQGDTPEAIALGERALRILEGSVGPEHPDVGALLNDLADFYQDDGQPQKALALLDRARGILERAHGPQSAQVAHTYQYIADIQRRQQQYPEALANYQMALRNWEGAYGRNHRLVAAALAGMAMVYRDQGDDDKAAPLWDDILAIRVKVLGPEHHHVASVLHQQARLLARRGQTTPALEKALSAERIGRQQLRESIRNLAERPGLLYAEDRSEGAGLNVALSLAARGGLSPGELRRVWDALVDARAFVLDEMALRRRALREMDDDEARGLWERLAAVSAELSNAVYAAGDTVALVRLQRDKEAVEAQLAARSAAFRAQRARQVGTLADVEAALPRGAALVSFARYIRVYDKQASYVALVRTTAGALGCRDLGPASVVESAAQQWLQQAGAGAGRALAARDERDYRAAALALRRRVWDPLAADLAGASAVYVVPDGQLQLVNFLALPADADGRYLVDEDVVVHTLAAERDLLDPAAAPHHDAGLLALGNPDFDAESGALRAVLASASGGGLPDATSHANVFRGERAPCRSFEQVRFGPLPRSGDEVDEIAALWRGQRGTAVTLTGAAATEAAFKRMAAGKRVLHLATHGFFLGEQCEPSRPGQRGVGGVALTRDAPPPARGNPLLMSGLAVAGANARASAAPDGEDGILTAEEIAALDLSSSEWAVLSACDTGIGVVQAGEGVLGLRRAFQIAGVRTVVLSLWSVRDEVARRWMTAFYTARLEPGTSTAQCLQRASRAVLAQRRAARQSTHPYYWASFTATGDWR